MAMAQAMAYGLPGVMFDLPNLKDYYTKGVVKVPCFDYEKFAEEIVRLLTQKEHYDKMRREALEFASEWEWSKVCTRVWNDTMRFLSLPQAVA
jgi:glycosyltransferase involved in cell wall biosynthesis